ncbi:hypothetical protein MSAN_01503300 [Mycena sanguinolenta]|uniref:Uncharacterized protein n=1 Tax=Mycena sanguinolenta TaxID=230812 RepID=A0A8H7CZI8_9AGAR|nr:hypothetical protein MSAN_01503300 [Mycena sanguinolenta]
MRLRKEAMTRATTAEYGPIRLQATAPELPITALVTTAAALVDENANRARTSSPASSLITPPTRLASLASSPSLTPLLPIPILRPRTHPSENQTQNPASNTTISISPATALLWTDHGP